MLQDSKAESTPAESIDRRLNPCATVTPLPGWLAGAQTVALNFSNNDLPMQLHFAMFNRTGGYVLKPPTMLCEPSRRPTLLTATFSPSSDCALTSARDNSRRGSEEWPGPNE
eukprot:4109105-Prymnesium_polylepis.1